MCTEKIETAFLQSRQIFYAVTWFDCPTCMSSSGQILVRRAETDSVTGEGQIVASWAHLVLLFHMHPQCRGLISALKYSWRAAERKLGQFNADLTLLTHYTDSACSAEHHNPQISCCRLSFSPLSLQCTNTPQKVIFHLLILFLFISFSQLLHHSDSSF